MKTTIVVLMITLIFIGCADKPKEEAVQKVFLALQSIQIDNEYVGMRDYYNPELFLVSEDLAELFAIPALKYNSDLYRSLSKTTGEVLYSARQKEYRTFVNIAKRNDFIWHEIVYKSFDSIAKTTDGIDYLDVFLRITTSGIDEDFQLGAYWERDRTIRITFCKLNKKWKILYIEMYK